jgi:hypothetical protein
MTMKSWLIDSVGAATGKFFLFLCLVFPIDNCKFFYYSNYKLCNYLLYYNLIKKIETYLIPLMHDLVSLLSRYHVNLMVGTQQILARRDAHLHIKKTGWSILKFYSKINFARPKTQHFMVYKKILYIILRLDYPDRNRIIFLIYPDNGFYPDRNWPIKALV